MERIICDCDVIHKEVVTYVKDNLPDLQMQESVCNAFKIIGDPTRFKILTALNVSTMCVCDISYLLDMTKSSISHQLKILKKSGLVKSEKKGKNVFYSLDDDHVVDIINLTYKHINHKQKEILV